MKLAPWLRWVLVAVAACGAPAAPTSAPATAAAVPDARRSRLPGPGEVSRIDAELVVKGIAEDAFVVTHEPFQASNVLVVRMPDRTVVLCSSPFETEATRALVRWVEAALAPSRIIAINTHFHLDGTGGNEAYRELGVVTYASDHTQRLLAEKGERHRAGAAAALDDDGKGHRVEAMKIVAAEKTFPERDGLVLTLGGEEVRIVYPGAAHSPDNLLVFFPSRGLLFGGCMIKASRSIGYVGDADLDGWERAVDVARGLGARTVVPGHGSVSGPDLFDLTASVVREARADRNARLFNVDAEPADGLSRAAPGAVRADALDDLVREAAASRSDTLLVLKDGKAVCERYTDAGHGPLETMSVTKSFVSLAIGYLLADGKIPSLDVPLSRYFPEFGRGLKAKVTLRHILTHTSGIEHRPAAGVLTKQDDRLAYVRSLPVVEEPGTHFSYNNEAVQLLSGVVAIAAKEPVDVYLDKRLFGPLGIRDWSWAKDKKGNVATFYGLSLSARDLAKVGQVLLSGGRLRDQPILPSSWIDESTRPSRSDASWIGLLWWIETDGPWWVQTPESLAGYAPASFAAASKLAALSGRKFASPAGYWAEAGARLSPSERTSFVSWIRDDRHPFTKIDGRRAGFRADGWLGQYLVVYPDLGLVGVRQHREPKGGGDEKENETYGFKEFAGLVGQLAAR